MGKPFSQELELLQETFLWSLEQDISLIEAWKADDTPVLVVGSGGSLSACFFTVNLLQAKGILSKAITPLELQSLKNLLRKSRLIFISSGGRNNDIILAYKTALEHDPVALLTVCMRSNTPLSKLSSMYSTSQALEYRIPAGKDGFLATNSLVGYFTLFLRAFSDKREHAYAIDSNPSQEITDFAKHTTHETTLCVLYGNWGQSVAIDIESKFTEAALGNVHIADYRNFAHGRHHWFAKRPTTSAIVALITPDDEMLAAKTLQILPASIPRLVLTSNFNGPFSSIALLVKSFRLVEAVGKQRGIDPGRPGVPSFGRKLYNLRYTTLLPANDQMGKTRAADLLPILKKAKTENLYNIDSGELKYWANSYSQFRKKLGKAKFGAIVFDYDGTLCRPADRFKHLSSEIKARLNEIAKRGMVISVVTGRGQSVRKELQEAIEKKYWKNVLVGYYNGADVGLLQDNTLPRKHSSIDNDLSIIYDLISNYQFPFPVNAELRPKQLTIEINDISNWKKIRPLLLHLIMSGKTSSIQVLESSHSMDIIKRPDVAKTNILRPCMQLTKARGLGKELLCIGDRGQWPGNDFELLSTTYSLSVDEVSSEKDHCWNIAPAGIKGVDATLLYLDRIKFSKTHFNFTL